MLILKAGGAIILLKRILIVFCLFAVQAVSALEVDDLYETEVLAKSRSEQDRKLAFQQALKIVLGRVLVADDISQQKLVKTALQAAEQYVREFQYSMAAGHRYAGTGSRLLRVRFDEDMIQQLFRDSGIGIWNEVRPETLVWLVIEKNGQRRFYNAETMPEVEHALLEASRLKGIPVIFPMLDLEEEQLITVNDVLSADPRLLLDVSSRYDVVSILAGRMLKKGHCWQAEWALYFNDKISQWNSPCESLKKAALSGMQGVYAELSRFYGVKPAKSPVKYQFNRYHEPYRAPSF